MDIGRSLLIESSNLRLVQFAAVGGAFAANAAEL
jgi:hypothetical protein